MPVDNDIIELSATCREIKIELAGMKEILKTLTANQAELVKFGEKSLYFEKSLNDFKAGLDQLFGLVREIKDCRLEPRVRALEGNQKWVVITALGAVGITLIRGLF